MDKRGLKTLSDEEFIRLMRMVMKEGKERHGTYKAAKKAAMEIATTQLINEEIIKKLKEVEGKYGYVNYSLWMKEGNYPTYASVRSCFKSFELACEKAGVMKRSNPDYTDEEIFEGMRKQAEKYDSTLSAKQYIYSGQKPGYHAIKTRFGTFEAACIKAGVKNAYGRRDQKPDLSNLTKCPKCGRPWVPPTGKASYCLKCEEGAKERNRKKKAQKEQ